MNDHGVAYRDLNTPRILLDRHGNACLGDMGIVTACKSVGEAMEYETDGYRWLAPEVCPYSFTLVLFSKILVAIVKVCVTGLCSIVIFSSVVSLPCIVRNILQLTSFFFIRK